MSRHRVEFSVRRMAHVFAVSRSGFYAWCRRQQQPSTRTRVRQVLDQRVAQAFLARKGRYGAPRLAADLADAGTHAEEGGDRSGEGEQFFCKRSTNPILM
jgi:hypothetical protein